MSYSKGLEGVIAGETAISHVEGELGRLSYRGYSIEALVAQPYEAVIWLVLFGHLPDKAELGRLKSFLDSQGELTNQNLAQLNLIDTSVHPMAMLQAMMPLLETDSSQFENLDSEATKGLAIIAKLPQLLIRFYAKQSGRTDLPGGGVVVGSENNLASFLSAFNGKPVPAEFVDILSVVQILQIDHSFNAGTFATRVVSSTLAPIGAVLAAGAGALAGELHGGADEAALRDAKNVGSPEAAAAYVAELLARKGKLMGMGHREYKTVDPRSVILKPLAEKLCMGSESESDYLTLCALEAAFNQAMALKGKSIWANLEFYKGVVYEAIGIPMHYFTAVFALSRSVGWLAHFIESRADNRIIRPKALYVGEEARDIV